MTDQILRFLAWLRTREGRKLIRYSLVSVISTTVSFVVLFLVYGVFRAWTEVPSTVFANVVATFPSYWLNRRWVWGKGGRSQMMGEVVPFWVISVLGIAFSIVGAAVARQVSQTYALSHVEGTALVLVANVMSFGVFWVAKLMLFNRLFHVPSLAEGVDATGADHVAEGGGAPGMVALVTSSLGNAGGSAGTVAVGGAGGQASRLEGAEDVTRGAALR